MHVVRTTTSEDVADLFALHQRGGRSAHVARLESVALGGGEVHRDLQLRHAFLELHVGIADPVDLRERVSHLVRLAVDEIEIRPEDAHDDRLARAGDHLVDPLVQVRLHVVEHPGIAGDGVLDGGSRLLVVGRGADGDPVLAEVDSRDLVGQERLPDVSPEVLDPG